MSSRIEHIRHVYQEKNHPFDKLWAWAIHPDSARERYARFKALQQWADERAKASSGHEAEVWHDRRNAYRRKKRAIFKRLQEQEGSDWPDSIAVAELLYHDPPHCHFASSEREKLKAVAAIAENRWTLRVGEFPPFDDVECVHTSGSWHYRTAGGGTVLPCDSPRLNYGGDAGCAMDVTGIRQYSFYLDLRARYG